MSLRRIVGILAVLAFASGFRAQESYSNVVVTLDRPLDGGIYQARLPVFFPPFAPVLGTPLVPIEAFDLRFVASPSLGDYVGEYFYPALATLLAEDKVSKTLAQRLSDYLRARDAEERVLLGDLDQAFRMPPGPQLVALQQSSLRQSPNLDQLEKVAESLRQELIAAGTTWDSLRRIPFSQMKGQRQKTMRGQFLQSVAFYRDNLSPLQRDLLVEAALESAATEAGMGMAPFVTVDRRLLFFLPGAARLAVPRRAGAQVSARVDQYEKLKARLRGELVDAAVKWDLDTSRRATQAWSELSRVQATGLADLERTADDLRRELQVSGIAGWPAPEVQWPDDFARELLRYRTAKSRVVAARATVLEQVRKEMLSYRPGADGKHFSVTSIPMESSPGTTYYINKVGIFGASVGPSGKAVVARLTQTLDEFDREHAPAIASLAKDEATLGPQAARIMRLEAEVPASQALALALKVSEQSACVDEYAEYQIAVLKLGMSPAQRRLLFRQGLRRLRLPLPGGELQLRD